MSQVLSTSTPAERAERLHADALAEVREAPLAELCEQITANAEQAFGTWAL